jgi:hypothetical protein
LIDEVTNPGKGANSAWYITTSTDMEMERLIV